jgi:hypothetical protein
MSVIMTGWVEGDPQKLEEWAAQNTETMRTVLGQAKEHGLIAHRFYGSEDGQILVLDEWPDSESFHRFFESQRSEIEPMFQAAGVTGEPQFRFWRELETHDRAGWGA